MLARLRAGRVGLRAALWRAEGAEAGLVLLLPGRTEYLEKYAPVAELLAARGFAVASLDWRGQGLSDRDPRVGRLGHVGDFAEYQEDLRALLGWEEVASRPGPRLLLAHSMGGCIGLRALTDGALAAARPQAAVFSAPMWGLAPTGLPEGMVRLIAQGACAVGLSRRQARGRAEAPTYVLEADFEGNVLTTDGAEWTRFVETARAHPELTTTAPTFGWLRAAFREMDALSRAAPPVPRLLLLGDREAVVAPEAIRAHAARGAGAELAPVPGSPHEPLMHRPAHPAGAAAWAAIDAFLAARGLGRPEAKGGL